jgi:glyoxylase-like metal-dependent hydrolase (beta-lactamase superfamily II)
MAESSREAAILPGIARGTEKADDGGMLRVYALSCGSLEFEKNLFFPASAAGERILAPVSSYLIVHPKGKLVFDTGIHCDALADPVGRLGKRVASLFAVHSRAGDGVVGQLAALGLKPDDIRYVVNSHFHFDHCGCNASFPRATFLVQRAELATARAEPKRYDAKDWDLPLDYRGCDGEYDVFGDGTVVLLPTPGHTAGHQSLWIRAGGATQFLLAADACYTREHLEKMILPTNAYDAAQMTESMNRLRSLRDRQGVVLLYGHDAEQWNALPRGQKSLI